MACFQNFYFELNQKINKIKIKTILKLKWFNVYIANDKAIHLFTQFRK